MGQADGYDHAPLIVRLVLAFVTASLAWGTSQAAAGPGEPQVPAAAKLGAPGYDPFGPTSASYNMLIGTAVRDPVSGTPALRSYLCEIRLAAEAGG